jgi:ribonucleotide monophosphatase NagD (HAD superfamily)
VGADQTIILGDRLYTDIACGKNAGVRTGLVLTGETTREMLSASAVQPDFVFESLQTVTQMLEAAA